MGGSAEATGDRGSSGEWGRLVDRGQTTCGSQGACQEDQGVCTASIDRFMCPYHWLAPCMPFEAPRSARPRPNGLSGLRCLRLYFYR